MEIKNVIVNEIHWSIGWNASQEANKRLKDKIGETSKYFAQLKVGNATYNWTVDTIGKWRPLGMAPDSDKSLILEKTTQIRQEVFAKLASEENLATKICQVPNYEEYIFYKDNEDGTLDVVITGWGFHNFKKSGPFIETWPPSPVKHNTTIAFVINGERQPQRTFSIITPKMQKPDITDEQGIRTYCEYEGLEITVIDDITQRQFSFVTQDKDLELTFDITPEPEVIEEPVIEEEPVVEEPVVEEEPVKKGDLATISVLDAQGQPMKNALFRLQQGEQTVEGQLNEQGAAIFAKDGFSLDQPLQAHITTENQQQLEPIEFTLEEGEKEYVLQQNAPESGSNLISILVFLLILAALAALVIFALKPGTEELTKLINKNIF